MEVKRGLPLQDLSGKRGFPDDPRLAANEKMQAEVRYIAAIAKHTPLSGAIALVALAYAWYKSMKVHNLLCL